jgi:signal transduction histidine kinase
MKVNEKQQKHRQVDRRHSWWHSPFLGYPFAVLFAAGAFLIPMFEKSLGIQNYFVGPPFFLATLLVGWIWGIGPALLAVLLEVLAIDYWIIPPLGTFDFVLWPDIASFAPFIIIQLIVLGLVVAQKNARQRLRQSAEQLAKSNARLEQASQVKDQFISMASHELRTPLTSMQGYVQLLLRRLKKQSAQNPEWLAVCDSLGKVDEQTHELTALVNELLDINILRSGKMPVRLAPCDLCVVCRGVVEGRSALTGRQIDLNLSSCPLVLQSDEGRLSQVVNNLVSNALKYSPTSARVCVEVQQQSGEAILAVHNEGSVLSKAQQETIFEPFYRSPDAQSSTTPGWGLGLAICKEIVMQHSGRIWVESSEEKGTTFFVALPLSTSSESV